MSNLSSVYVGISQTFHPYQQGDALSAIMAEGPFTGLKFLATGLLTGLEFQRKTIEMSDAERADLIEKIKEYASPDSKDCSLTLLWNCSAALHELGKEETSLYFYRFGQKNSHLYEDDNSAFIIYDWLFAADNYWHYGLAEKMNVCLQKASAMVDPDTREEFEEFKKRIAAIPCPATWIEEAK